MRKYKTLCAIAYGGRIEKGSIVELPDDVAKAYGREYVVPADDADEVDHVVENKSIDDMSLLELKSKAEELGLKTSGSKADLVERLTLHTEQKAETETEETNDDVETEVETEVETTEPTDEVETEIETDVETDVEIETEETEVEA